MRARVAAILLLFTGGCERSPAEDVQEQPGGDSGGTVAAFGECLESGDCAEGLECVPWRENGRSYCLEPCAGDTCDAGSHCAGGYCLHSVAPYAELTAFADCGAEAVALSLDWMSPARCLPRCDPEAPDCPPLPAEIVGAPPGCTAGLFPGVTVAVCTTQVAVGERCDKAGLRCDGAERPDADPALEGTGGHDPGAVDCLYTASGSRCLLVCSVDSGATRSACACPAGDPLCAEPADPGLAWQCRSWAELEGGVEACVPVESCAGAECADNASSGLTQCATSPYAGDPGTICVRP